MTTREKEIARLTFRRILQIGSELNLGQQAMLKAAYTGLLSFDKLPESMQVMFMKVGTASEAVAK